MSFFDRYLADSPPPVRRTVARPAWSQPQAVLPGVAPLELVLVRTDDVAIAIPDLLAYPNGFEFHLAVRLRTPSAGDRMDFFWGGPPGPGGRVATGDVLRLAVVYPDGRAATNVDLRHRMPEPDGGLLLSPNGGGGGGGSYDMRYWVHPLPPPGSVTFICEWPHLGLSETRVEVPAQTILDASARAVTLWPEPEDEVYEPEPPASGSPPAAGTAHTSRLSLSFGAEGAIEPPIERPVERPSGTADPEQRT